MASRIKIDDTYRIDIEDGKDLPRNWILVKRVATKPTLKNGKPAKNAGKPHDITVGFFSTLAAAMDGYANQFEHDQISKAVGPVDLHSLKTVLLRIEKVCRALKLVEIDVQKGTAKDGN